MNVKDAGKKILDAWQNTKKSQKILIVAVIVLTIIAISAVVTMANQVEYEDLYVGLSNEQAGEVITQLEKDGIDVQSYSNGVLRVPKGQANELRYKLQAQGIPAGDSLDFNIYSENASSFGATDKDKAYYAQMQLQQNLAQTVNRMDKIKNSTVMLSLAEESKFALSDPGKKESTASVMVTLNPNVDQLSQTDVDAIRAIVSKGVPSLTEANIAIVDQNMHSYGTMGESTSVGTGMVGTQIELQDQVAAKLKQQIINLLTPVFGVENLSANVNVQLDFDRKTTNTLTLSPPTGSAANTGLVTSMKQTTERLQNAGTTPQGAVGMDPNGGAPTYQEIDTAAQDGTYYNVVTDFNAELNEISEQIEQAQGDISYLSAAVIVNGGEDLADVLPGVRQLIANAIGVPENRITVSSMPFDGNAAYTQMMEEQAQKLADAQQTAMLQSLILPLAILAVIVIVLFILLNSFRKNRKAKLEEERRQKEEEERAALRAAGIDVAADEELSIEELLKEKNDDMLKQVQMLVDKNPEVIAQLLRNWLSDDFGGSE